MSKSFIFKTLIVMALWGSLFPSVKLGYSVFDITSTGDLLLFAGVRFTICGALICVYKLITDKGSFSKLKDVIPSVIWTGIFAVTLHYSFTYSALKITESSALVAILKQVGMVFYVCFSFLFFKEDRPTIVKFIAAFIGFAGIIVINITPDGISFGLGEVLVLLASFCTVFSNIFGKKAVNQADSLCVTGVSQLLGGAILLVTGYLMGGCVTISITSESMIFIYICLASIISYCLWYATIKHGELSKLFIIKFAEPMFAALFGILIVNESFKMQYLLGFIMICFSIYLTGKSKQSSK